MGNEFNLSDKMIVQFPFEGYFDKKDIQKFIDNLKMSLKKPKVMTLNQIIGEVNKLAGSQFK